MNIKIIIFLLLTPFYLYSQEIDDEDKKPPENGGEKVLDKKTIQHANYFENAIQNFEKADKKNFPPANAIVCIGSSSMRFWHPTIEKDLAQLTIIPRGFGGSDLTDALVFVDRIVTPYKPRAVVIYEGENDIVMGTKPEKVAEDYREFVKKVHKELPEARLYFISLKPSVGRWYLWEKMNETNQLIAKDCAKDKRLIFVDMTSAMLDSEGKPRPDLFGRDGYHMNKEGYAVWTQVLRPILTKNELEFETKKTETPVEENKEKPKETQPQEPKKITPIKPEEKK